MRRYVDTLYQYWLLALIPILVLPVGAYVLLKTPPTTYGTANIWVDQASLQQLSYVEQGASPAQTMADYLTQFLVSPKFDLGVATRSPAYRRYLLSQPLPKGVAPNLSVLAQADLSKKAAITPGGPSLVTVAYETTDPLIAAQVVRSILKEAAYETAQLNQLQAIAHDTSQLKKAQTAYKASVGNLGTYMTANGIKSSQLAAQQLSDPQLAALYQAVQTAQTNLTNAQQQLAQVEAQQSSQAAIRVLDQPSTRIILTSKKKQLTGLLIPFVLGLILSGAFLVIMTLRDRSLRSPDDAIDLLGLPVLAVVPYTKISAASRDARHPRPMQAAREA